MGSPLYTQEQELNRQGITLTRQTMSNWMLTASRFDACYYIAFFVRFLILNHYLHIVIYIYMQIIRVTP